MATSKNQINIDGIALVEFHEWILIILALKYLWVECFKNGYIRP